MHLAVGEQPHAGLTHVGVIAFVSLVEQLQIDEVVSPHAAGRAHSVQLLGDLVAQRYDRNRAERRKTQVFEDGVNVFGRNEVGFVCVANLVVAYF